MGALFLTILIIATVVLLGIEIESAYADSSAAAIAYRSNNVSGPDFPKYRQWNPSTLAWGSEVELPTAGSPVRFAWLEFSPVSAKRVMVTLSDDGFLDSYVCDNACTSASSWTVTNDIVDLWTTAPMGAQRPFDMKFEATSGDLMLVYDKVSSSSTQDLFYRVMPNTATSFGAEGSIDDTTATSTDTVYSFIRMATKFSSGSDSIGMIALDQTSSNSIAFVWDGSNWGNQHELTATASIGTEEVIGIDWETSSGNLVIVSGEGTSMRFNRFTTTWETSANFGTWDIGNINWVMLHANPVSSSNELFVVAVGDLDDMDSAYWSGSAWTDHIEHDAAVDSHIARIVDFSWSGDSSMGILLWATASGQLDFKKFTAPNTFSGQLFFAESGTHPWIQLASPPNPTAGDTVSALGATLDSTFDLGGIRWDDGSASAVSTGDGGITTDTSASTYESYKISWQRSTNIIRVFAETLSTTDAFSKGFGKTLSDTLTLVDDMVLSSTKVIAEALAFADTVVKAYSKHLTETISLSDTLTVTGQFIRNLNESLVLTDTNIREFSRRLDDTLTLSDTTPNAVARIQDVSETLGMTDTTLTPAARIQDVSETLGMTDTTPNAANRDQTVSDTLGMTDATTTTADKVQDISDALSMTDTIETTAARVQDVSVFLSMTDATVNAANRDQTVSDSLTLSDTTSSAASRVQDASDTLTTTDTTSIPVNRVQTPSDSLSMIDATETTAARVQDVSDSLGITDTTETTAAKTRDVSDTLTLSDATLTSAVKIQHVSDSLSMTDTTVNTANIDQTVSDTLSMTDAASTSFIKVQDLSDALVLADSAIIGTGFLPAVTETLSLSDTVTFQATRELTVSETLNITEDLQNASSNTINLGEALAFADTVVQQGGVSTLPSEAMILSDGVQLTHTIPLFEGISFVRNFLGGLGELAGGTITFPNITAFGEVSVTAAGEVSITTSTVTETPPSGFTIVGLGGSTLAIDITTTAAFTGTVQICVTYDDTGVDPSLEPFLQFRHFVGGTWVDITSSLDTTNNIVCGVTDSLSPFAVMSGPAPEIGGSNRERTRYEISDVLPPIITEHYIKPEQVSAGNDIIVTAKIADDVGVAEASIIYLTNIEVGPPEFHQVSMEKFNAEWWRGTIPSSDVTTGGLTYWIFAEDFARNNVQSAVQSVEIMQSLSAPETKAMQKNLPDHVLQAIKPKVVEPVERLEVVSLNSGNEIKTFTDKIVITNTGNRTVDNIRIILSPEISKSFKLSDQSLKSIEPNTNVTLTLELNGSPNRDMLGGLAGYNGQLMVMAEHVSPILLPVNIGAERSDYVNGYIDKLATMAEQRYNKISLLNSILTKQSKEQYNYEVTTSNGDAVITSPSDELIIKNLSDKELKNLRIYVSNAGQTFLLEQNNIRSLEPNSQVSIKLTPKMDGRKYSPKDIKGELLIVPANDRPMQIPIDIVREERRDSADEFEVRTFSGKDGIFTAADKIIIKNIGNRTLDSVRLMLPADLARVFTLSNDSFKHIEPNSEVVVNLKFRQESGEHKMGMQYDYQGELTVVSEHHRQKVIPVDITWNEVDSEHFLIYTRNNEGDIAKARDLITFLESNYQNITSRFGEMNTKTKIYMTSTLEEFRLLADSGHSHYAFSDDVIFICGCSDEIKSLAMKEFVYRITFNKYPNYSNKDKFMLDSKNWLMDGIANYITANMTGQDILKNQLESFKAKRTSFVWYVSDSSERYGATYTFFDYLHEKYGESVIDRTLYYLGSGMISNTRCDTLEDCAVLRAVYDVSGLDIKEKRHTLDVETLVSEWEDYVMEQYGVTIPAQD